jgi:hypothetical protein
MAQPSKVNFVARKVLKRKRVSRDWMALCQSMANFTSKDPA